MVVRPLDPVQHRIPHVDVRRRHVDLRAQDVGAVRELAGAHPPEEIQVLGGRPGAIGAVRARLGQGATVLPYFVAGLAVDVRLSLRNQFNRVRVQLIEVVGGEMQTGPFEAQPSDVRLDGVDVLDVFLRRVRVVEPEVAGAAVVPGHAEIQADRLGMADVEIAVGLGRKARGHTPAVPARGQVLGDDGANEIEQLLIIERGVVVDWRLQ